jgi:hypothetical protein
LPSTEAKALAELIRLGCESLTRATEAAARNNELEYGRSARHYEFVAAQLAEYYKMYMQSWTVLVSAVLVGGLIALRASPPSASSPSLEAHAMLILPFVMAGWFLLTSWFWARFSMLRRYLRELEGRMQGCQPDLFRRDEERFWSAGAMPAGCAVFCAAAVYGLLVAAASAHFSFPFQLVVWVGYVALALTSIGLAYRFIHTFAAQDGNV